MFFRDVDDDLVVEILRRVPAERLWWSCRFVCKRWNALISSPYFRQLHQQQQQQSPSTFFVFARSNFPSNSDKKFYFPRDDDSKGCSSTERAFSTCLLESWKHHLLGDHLVWLSGSCNGLVLFRSVHDSNGFHIGNPMTRELKHVNVPNIETFCGFFYHSSTQRYKLLSNRRIRAATTNTADEYEYALLTLGSSTEWTSLSVLPYSVYGSPEIVNNTLYWMIDPYEGDSITMFSMDTQEFRTMSGPSNPHQTRSVCLLEMEGRLTCWLSSALVAYVWVFELPNGGNHMEGHWSRIYNLDLNQILRSYITPDARDPLYPQVVSIQNGELTLLWHHHGVFRYNLSTNTSEKMELEGISDELFNRKMYKWITRYTKTLASLNNSSSS